MRVQRQPIQNWNYIWLAQVTPAEHFMKSRTITIIALLVVMAAVAGTLAFPDLALRWWEYNEKMIRKVRGYIFPFFWINLGVAASVFLIEAIVVGWKQSSLHQLLHPNRSMRNDILTFLFNVLQVDYIIIFILTLGVFHKLKLGIYIAIGTNSGLLATAIPNPVIQMIIYVLAVDFTQFLQHYMHHRLSFLWPFHSYHHSATELNVLTANRGHPIQAEFTNNLITLLPLTLIGFPLVSLLIFRLIKNFLTFLHHSRLTWSWGWFGKYVLVSPLYHRTHHSALPEHFDKNLSVLFPMWDHIFGTHYHGKVAPVEMGLPDNSYNKSSFLDDMIMPFKMFRRKGENQNENQNGISHKRPGIALRRSLKPSLSDSNRSKVKMPARMKSVRTGKM